MFTLHELLKIWFHWVENWGYWGVFILMAMESSIIPVPSELVLPPAAFWAAQGKMKFWGVIFAGTAGSCFGSLLCYSISVWVGYPFILRYGKYVFISEKAFGFADRWVQEFGGIGVFAARLLPVLRHLVSIPAGILRMDFKAFFVSTFFGAGIWCIILSEFGQRVMGSHPELLDSPEAMIFAIKEKLVWFIVVVFLIFILYLGLKIFQKNFMKNKVS